MKSQPFKCICLVVFNVAYLLCKLVFSIFITRLRINFHVSPWMALSRRVIHFLWTFIHVIRVLSLRQCHNCRNQSLRQAGGPQNSSLQGRPRVLLASRTSSSIGILFGHRSRTNCKQGILGLYMKAWQLPWTIRQDCNYNGGRST